jgi:hypothetical protein
MCDATGLSQRRACRLTGLSLSTCRYEAQRPASDAHLSGRIYKKTKNLRVSQLLLGHKKLESTVRYLDIEVDDALEISESIEV